VECCIRDRAQRISNGNIAPRDKRLQCRARSRGDGASSFAEIAFPDGHLLRCDDPQANAEVSALIGHESVLQPLRTDAGSDFYRRYKRDGHTWLEEPKATFEREQGEPMPDLDTLPEVQTPV